MADQKPTLGGVDAATKPVQSIEIDEPAKVNGKATNRDNNEGDADADGSDNDAPGEADDEAIEVMDLDDGRISNNLYKEFKAITEVLLNFKIKSKNNEEHFPSTLFKRLPNKRLLPDYYEVIKEPSAISTLRGKIQRKQYTGVPEFVRDFALVVHNAQVYNRPNSQPVRDALKLDEIFKQELQKLLANGFATEEDVKYPDLGEIPYASPEPDPVSEEEDLDDEDDEEDDEIDDSDDEKRKKKGRRTTKSATGRRGEDDDEEEKGGDGEQKRRGRPPKVATPMEHRIDRILKSLKKSKAPGGGTMIGPFERLPDKTELPEYYQVITNPMAYDILKKKAKRKKYQSIEEFMKDVELMFNNAMTFNEDGSDIHKWAQELLQEARRAEAEERAKPDADYLQAAEGRIPLSYITHKSDTWKVGDWVHIQNPNDITKPIVAQIYRTWKTINDEEWINACWYYRPEQTVHQYEKHFFPNEVVKTGQYRDHKIEEVLNKCFVMFYTRYNRGRPRNLPNDAEVYVCEARYNEEKFKFNKIKTWASCLPDEVRDKDYEMDLFDAPRKIKKIPSPLLSRLKDGAKETDELPQPEWKHSNAPPLVGGIHKRQRDENQSPPPEPTPPPQAVPAPIARTPSTQLIDAMRAGAYQQASPGNMQTQNMRPVSANPIPAYAPNNPAQYSRQNSFAAATPLHQAQAQAVQTQAAQSYQYTPQQTPAPLAAAHPGAYSNTVAGVNYNRPAPVPTVSNSYNTQQSGSLPQHRSAEAYTLNSAANESIPKEIRDQFPQDDNGHVLFFTAPPLDNRTIIVSADQKEVSTPLQHSEGYTKALTVRKRKFDESKAIVNGNVDTLDSTAQRELGRAKSSRLDVPKLRSIYDKSVGHGLSSLAAQVKSATYNEYQSLYGGEWQKVLLADLDHAERQRRVEISDDRAADEKRDAFKTAHLGKYNGQFALNEQGYISSWEKNFFTGVYLDDVDSRLP